MSMILIADDNYNNSYVLAAALKSSGYEVTTANNGTEALALAQKAPPDLIISDILMPGMDGYELCRRWRADARLGKIPFIFYTATYTDTRDEQFGLRLGADRFIVKPVAVDAMRVIVSEVLAESLNGTRHTATPPPLQDKEALREYNDVISRKLQHKVEQLEQEVSAHKAAKGALEKMAKELKDKNCELQDFLYISSRDLRDPLITVQGFSESLKDFCGEIYSLLKQENRDQERLGLLLHAKMPEALKHITAGVASMDNILSGLQKMGHLWSKDLTTEALDMDKLVSNVVSALYVQLKEAGALVKHGKLPPCAADKAQLSQVFRSLLDNSIKYRDPSRELEITVTGKELGAGTVSYTVADNGRGLKPVEEQGKIWELFYRGNPKDPVPGEGVGLTIAKRIIEKHGGSIKAGPAAGGGAVFTVELPCGKHPA